jgi:hypothetical protein
LFCGNVSLPVAFCYDLNMAAAKQSQSRRTGTPPSTRGRKAQKSSKKALRELYTRLEKTQPGSEESKRISEQIVDAIG